MPENDPKPERGERKIGDSELLAPSHTQHLSLPPVPDRNAVDQERRTSEACQSFFEFDQRVKAYGEALKQELMQRTKRNAFGEPVWQPYRFNLERIPPEYHERVAHYLLQAYRLPCAEEHIAYNAAVFQQTDPTKLACALIARGLRGIWALGRNLRSFGGADERIVFEGLTKLQGIVVHYRYDSCEWIKQLDFFKEVPHREILNWFLDNYLFSTAFSHLERFRLSDDDQKNVVDELFRYRSVTLAPSDLITELIPHLHRFQGIDHGDVLERAIYKGLKAAREVAVYLPMYPHVDVARLADACRRADRDEDAAYFQSEVRKTREVFDPSDITSWDKNAYEKGRPILAAYFSEFLSLKEDERAQRVLDFHPKHVLANSERYPTLRHQHIAIINIRHRDRYNFESSGIGNAELHEGLRRNPEKAAAFFGSFSNLSQLMPQERLAVVGEIIREFQHNGRAYVISHLEDFLREIRHEVVELFFEDDISECLLRGRFLGFSPGELFKKYHEVGVRRHQSSPVCTLQDREIQRWVSFGGHDHEIASALIEGGKGYLVIENISCFEGLTNVHRCRAGLQGVVWSINQGRVDSARKWLEMYAVSVDEVNCALEEQLKGDISLDKPTPESLLRMAGISAWSLYYPSILNRAFFLEVREKLEPYRRILGPTDSGQLERNAKQNLLENLVSKGVPLLSNLGWFRPDTLDLFAEILPSFLNSTTGSEKAWLSHDVNLNELACYIRWGEHMRALAREEVGPTASQELVEQRAKQLIADHETRDRRGGVIILADQEKCNPVYNLKMLRSFYQEFGVIEAPTLFQKWYKARIIEEGRGSDAHLSRGDGTTRDFSEYKDLRNMLAGQRPLPSVLPSFAQDEYLASWTHVRISKKLAGRTPSAITNAREFSERMHKFSSLARWGRISPEDPRLKARVIRVSRACSDESDDSAVGTVDAPYRRIVAMLEQLKNRPLEELFVQERNAVRDSVAAQHRDRLEWLAEEENIFPASPKVASARAQISLLKEQLQALDRVENPKMLMRFLCRTKNDRFKPTVIRLAVSMGLERTLDREDLFHSLEMPPSRSSLVRLVDFIANNVRDAALRPLEEEPKVLHVAEKFLGLRELERAVARGAPGRPRRVEKEGNQPLSAQSSEEIIVLPTRGLLAELAGYFSDACWIDQNDLMAQHPHATALIFLRREKIVTEQELKEGTIDVSNASLLGACYILQTKDANGNDVLVLRGINPRERACSHLDMGSFIEQLLDEVVVPYAKILGATKVVIPFDALGHAQTNRQGVSEYLHEQYAESAYLPLDATHPGSIFNERLIFDKCRIVRPKPPALAL